MSTDTPPTAERHGSDTPPAAERHGSDTPPAAARHGSDPDRTAIVLFEYGGRVREEMRAWLKTQFPKGVVRSQTGSPYICARNRAIRDGVLKAPSHIVDVVFCDNDVRPTERTAAWLTIPGDVVACRCDMSAAAAWDLPWDFHTPLWRAKVEVFRKIAPPWFDFVRSGDGCTIAQCDCQYFRDKCLRHGLEVRHGGWAQHDMSGSWRGQE